MEKDCQQVTGCRVCAYKRRVATERTRRHFYSRIPLAIELKMPNRFQFLRLQGIETEARDPALELRSLKSERKSRSGARQRYIEEALLDERADSTPRISPPFRSSGPNL